MPLKSSKTCCGFVWIPDEAGTAPLLATASYAGFVGRNFSNSSFLEIREVDVLKTDDSEMKVCCQQALPAQACRLDWSPLYGKRGIIAVGCANGVVYVYDVQELLHEDRTHASALLCTIQGKERGAVKGCHFNGTQLFLATGYERGEWHLWSLQQIHDPVLINVDPNSPNSSLSSVSHLLWHPFIPHVLCVASLDEVTIWNTECRSTIKSIDTRALRAGCIAWNPVDSDYAEQLAIGCSKEPPVIQLWNMNEFAPKRELVGHVKGITGLSWCQIGETETLLASCDNAGDVLLWDPHRGSKVGHISIQFNIIDVHWCPSLPFVLATSSSEPLLSVHSVLDAIDNDEYFFYVRGQPSNPSCRVSMNMSRDLACLESHSFAKIQIKKDIRLMAPQTVDPVWRDLLQNAPNRGFPDDFLRIPRDSSADRCLWLENAGLGLFSALEHSKTSRQPFVDYLSQAQNDNSAEGTLQEESTDDGNAMYTPIAKCVASRKLEEAVQLCLNERNFDDAYALAGLGGAELFQKVHRNHLTFMTENHPEKRHLRYALAMTSGNYADLCTTSSQHELPWRELLLLFTLHVGEDYKSLCFELGSQRLNAGDTDGALTCFACCRDVDSCIDLWRRQELSIPELVYQSVLIEEVTDTKSQSPFFADCLFQCGYHLLKAGDVPLAARYLHRAAEIGHSTSFALLDRIMPGRYPSLMERHKGASLSDQASPQCIQFIQALDSVSSAAPEMIPTANAGVVTIPQDAQGAFPSSVSSLSSFPSFYRGPHAANSATTSINPPVLPTASGGGILSSRPGGGSTRPSPTSISSFSSVNKQRVSSQLPAPTSSGSPFSSHTLPHQVPQNGFQQQVSGAQLVPPPPPRSGQVQQGFQQQVSGAQLVPPPPPRPGQVQQGFQQQIPGVQQVLPPQPGQVQQGFQQQIPGVQQVPPPQPGQVQQGFQQQVSCAQLVPPPPPRPGQAPQHTFQQQQIPGVQLMSPPQPGHAPQRFQQQVPGGKQLPSAPPSQSGYTASGYAAQGYSYGF